MDAPAAASLTATIPVPLDELLPLAMDLERSERGEQAERLADRILAVLPEQPEALHVKGLVAFRAGRFLQAAALLEGALRHGLEASLYWRNICTVYERLNRLDDAVEAGRRAVELDPTDATAYHNLTIAHYRRLDLADCIACARRALALDPSLAGAHFALAEALLIQGAFPEGWEEYEWRFRIPGAQPPMPPTDRPHWDGAPLADGATLLLIADQGFGDGIQFARYLPWVAERCPQVAVACGAEMRPLLAQVLPRARLFSHWQECPGFAAFCTLSGLPRLHGTTLDNIPATVPYLHAEPARVERWRARLAQLVPPGYRLIGIAWGGRPTHNNDANRSATLADFAPLAACRRVALVSLQKGPPQAQAGGYHGAAPLVNLGHELESFEDTAAVIAALDLVVSVDTSVVHLAGAMGRPVWIMLPYAPDWRWLLGRDDSPWYPTARLFRQRAPREWGEVAEAVAAALRDGSQQ